MGERAYPTVINANILAGRGVSLSFNDKNNAGILAIIKTTKNLLNFIPTYEDKNTIASVGATGHKTPIPNIL